MGGPGRRGEREAMPSGAIGATDPRGRRATLPSPALAAGAQPCAQEGPGARLWRPSGACPVERKGGAWCDPQIRHTGNSPRRLSESGAKRGARPPKQSPDRGFFPPTENHLPVTGRGSPAEPGTERCSAPRRLGGGSQSEPALNRTPVRIALRRGRDRGWPPGLPAPALLVAARPPRGLGGPDRPGRGPPAPGSGALHGPRSIFISPATRPQSVPAEPSSGRNRKLARFLLLCLNTSQALKLSVDGSCH